MDTSALDITFDEQGICNHCKKYDQYISSYVFTGTTGKKKLDELMTKIKTYGKVKPYDSVLGLSGGCDSTYVAYLTKQFNLKPYLVSLSNGYDSSITTRNCQRIASYLNTDLHSHTIAKEEFKQMQLAYLRSGCVNIETLSDHAIWALLYQTAARLNVKYILSGNNFVTEGILPSSWSYDSKDLVNIMDIYKKHGNGTALKTFPAMTAWKFAYYHYLKGIELLSPLNFVSYDKEEAKKLFAKEFGYEDYGVKHAESIITRFYQFYMLPKRTGIDKRRAHLSCLICAGQLARETALEEIKKPAYTPELFKSDRGFIANYLGLSERELECLIELPIKSNLEYKTGKSSSWGKRIWLLMPVWLRKLVRLQGI